MTTETTFKKGDRVAVIAGRYAGRNGTITRMGSAAFSDYCHVAFDLKGREMEQKREFVLLNSLLPEVKL